MFDIKLYTTWISYGFLWFLTVSDGFLQFLMVSDGFLQFLNTVSYGFLQFLMVSPILLTCFPHFVISGARDFGDAMPRRAQFRWRRRLPPGALWCSLGTCGGG